MFLPGVTPSRVLFFSLVVLALVASLQSVQAKSIRSMVYSNLRNSDAIKMRRGGCAAFGHSCFGGHGKRAEAAPGDGEEAQAGLQLPLDDPRLPGDRPDPGDLGPVYSFQPDLEDYPKLSTLFKKWLANTYRRGDLVTINQ